MTYKVSADGKTAKAVNEFEHLGGKANPSLDLTEWCEPGSEISCEVVWQYIDNEKNWCFTDDENIIYLDESKKRQALKPLSPSPSPLNEGKEVRQPFEDYQMLSEAIEDVACTVGMPMSLWGNLLREINKVCAELTSLKTK